MVRHVLILFRQIQNQFLPKRRAYLESASLLEDEILLECFDSNTDSLICERYDYCNRLSRERVITKQECMSRPWVNAERSCMFNQIPNY